MVQPCWRGIIHVDMKCGLGSGTVDNKPVWYPIKNVKYDYQVQAQCKFGIIWDPTYSSL